MGTVIMLLLRLFWESSLRARIYYFGLFCLNPHFLARMPSFSFVRLVRFFLLCLWVVFTFSSCRSTRYYKQRVMFRLTDDKGHSIDTSKLRIAVNRVAKNYLIQPNDYLEVHVYTNKGERILDPNGELQFGAPGGARSGGRSGGAASAGSGTNLTNIGAGAGATSNGSDFLVQADGTVTLPLVNRVKVKGLSLLQADSVLKASYDVFYKETFVTTNVTNNRVFVLGSPGGKVIHLANDNMNLLEVLALAGGIDGSGSVGTLYRYGGQANNIRIIRGDLKNPQIEQIDLTTIDGMRRANLQIEPNDVIYVEPVRRPFLEALTDAAPAISALSLILNVTVIVITLFRLR